MSSAPRPKPWEASAGTSAAVASGQSNELPQSSTTSASTNTSTSSEPSIPERPTSLTSSMTSTSPYSYGDSYGLGSGMGGYGSSYSGLGGMGGYGSYGGLGGMGGLGSYGSRYGGMGSMYGGGYGGYGGYGGGYGGYGSGGMYGQNPGANGPGGFAESTQATFQLIESIIGAFGGFAQMLEATYMATHSSFFTMISVAEQFGHLKNALGSFLGIFALIKYAKKLLAKITGRQLNIKIDANEFQKFEAKKISNSDPNKSTKRISFKPLLIFLVMAIGTPWALKKLITHLASQKNLPLPGGYPNGPGGQLNGQTPTDLSSIEFGRALYNFVPENKDVELEMKDGDLVAILSKTDPMGKPSQWWRVRSRNGKTGYIPSNYIEIIKRKQTDQQNKQIESA
ncbi:Peroxisomal membrane protein PAS20 [Wickerhamomyces ciferrii]|uniref:Peroxisomal membrane protein PEX13 n=1 Tax=Wickerhamomyces ciferrii (strain ATCC 14091 / BCRC 22168 / CBS 111 / JCM 3599 / NBRC 0793 / NRRL Y-1031 F-60-10) TaxID=1206466 RepID=K0KER9_WICCF|nr:Peroxisomal membrane protein PAS20 [Wickerhamomyces ciferrii]CCH41431.1 Peroxisomal membrane protein PAS20 [Wickerhamomyces ciferrii]